MQSEFVSGRPRRNEDMCIISEVEHKECHHCRIGARNLGNLKDLLGFDDDDTEA